MESTCRKSGCLWWKKMKDDCPLYLESKWEDDKGFTKKVEDCAPVRNTLQLQVLHNLIIGLQKTSNEEREVSNTLLGMMAEVVKKAQEGRVYINGFNTEKAALPTPKS